MDIKNTPKFKQGDYVYNFMQISPEIRGRIEDVSTHPTQGKYYYKLNGVADLQNESHLKLTMSKEEVEEAKQDVKQEKKDTDMRIEESKTKVYKSIRGDWTAETIRTEKGQTFQITTLKNYSGKISTTATKVDASQSGGAKIISFSPLTDTFMRIDHGKMRATKKNIEDAHYKGLAEFDVKVNELPEEEIKSSTPEIGDIMLSEGSLRKAPTTNDRPSEESKQRFSPVKEIDRKQITIMPELFQGRQHPYSEESVSKIIAEGFDKSNDPIIVWFDAEKEKYIVISGHSRWEASERLYNSGKQPNLSTMPAKVFLGDQDEAVNYAVLESNRASTQEGFKSDLEAVRKMIAEGYNRSEMQKYIKPDSYLDKLRNYTYLNPLGRFVEILGTTQETSFPYLRRNAEWVGIIRKQLGEKISNEHEKEMFDYFYASDKKGLMVKKQKFFDLINNKVSKFDYDPSQPLNLLNIVSTSAITDPVNEQIKEINKQIDVWQKEIEKKRTNVVRANRENMPEMARKFNDEIRTLETAIQRKMEEKDKLNKQKVEMENSITMDLFSGLDNPMINDVKDDILEKSKSIELKQLSESAAHEAIDEAKDEATQCRIDLKQKAKKYGKEVFKAGEHVIIDSAEYVITKTDSQKLSAQRYLGKFSENLGETMHLGYDEIIEKFEKGTFSFDGYKNQEQIDILQFKDMVNNHQICMLKTESIDFLTSTEKSVDEIVKNMQQLKEAEKTLEETNKVLSDLMQEKQEKDAENETLRQELEVMRDIEQERERIIAEKKAEKEEAERIAKEKEIKRKKAIAAALRLKKAKIKIRLKLKK